MFLLCRMEQLEKKANDYRHEISFCVILDCLCFEDLPAMFASCVEVQRALRNYTGIVIDRWSFGVVAKNIVKKEVFDWYLARLSSKGTFGAPTGPTFRRWFSTPGHQQDLFEICLWHDSVPLLELLLQEAPSYKLKYSVLHAMRER